MRSIQLLSRLHQVRARIGCPASRPTSGAVLVDRRFLTSVSSLVVDGK